MPNNNFQILITAKDKASAIVNKVNAVVGKSVKPMNEVNKSSVAMKKSLDFDQVGKTFIRFKNSVSDAHDSFFNLISLFPKGSMAGGLAAGAAAVIVTANTLAEKWGNVGSEIYRTSTLIGISTDKLQLYRGVAKLVGISSDALTASFHSFGLTLQHATQGRNNTARDALIRLNVPIKRLKDGTVDTETAFLDLVDAMNKSKMPVQTKETVLGMLGIDPSMIILMNKGKSEIAALSEEVRKSGLVMGGPAIQAAEKYRKSVERLDESWTGLKYSIGAWAAPMLIPAFDLLAKGIGPAPADKSVQAPSRQLGIIRRLEGSKLNSVSPKGAIGVYQIMPGTAKQYGFDSSRLFEPAYNQIVASTILDSLLKKYNGDMEAVSVAYNAGPGVANKFLKSGKNMAVLPSETQKYLTRARKMLSEDNPMLGSPYGNQPAKGQVSVSVEFKNAPPGTKANTKTSGSVAADTKIGYAMPGGL